jgi:hypothetical protein
MTMKLHGLADDSLCLQPYDITLKQVSAKLYTCVRLVLVCIMCGMMCIAGYLLHCKADLHIVTSSKLCSCWVLLNVRGNCMRNQGREAGLPL